MAIYEWHRAKCDAMYTRRHMADLLGAFENAVLKRNHVHIPPFSLGKLNLTHCIRIPYSLTRPFSQI
jgi:hypothetical protein